MFSADIPLPLLLAAASVLGSLSSFLARRRGYNPYLWFFIGFLFGLFGIMAIFFAPRKKGAAPEAAPAPQPFISGPSDKFWYYLDAAHLQQGPFSLDAVTTAWKEGRIVPATLVWNEELPDWKPLQELIQVKKPV